MSELVPGYDRVLRKRNRPQYYEDINCKKLKIMRPYDVFDEHNYFNNHKKKKCRWPIQEMSLPEWLTEAGNSSDEEEENNNEVESLAYLLKMEMKSEILQNLDDLIVGT